MQFIEKYPDKHWDWREISSHQILQWKLLKIILIKIGLDLDFKKSKFNN